MTTQIQTRQKPTEKVSIDVSLWDFLGAFDACPPKPSEVRAVVIEHLVIMAQKTDGLPHRHEFRRPVRVALLAHGDLQISSLDGHRLWG